jgi:hypothetical protein
VIGSGAPHLAALGSRGRFVRRLACAAAIGVWGAALGCTPPDTGRLAPVSPPTIALAQPAPSDPSAVASAGPRVPPPRTEDEPRTAPRVAPPVEIPSPFGPSLEPDPGEATSRAGDRRASSRARDPEPTAADASRADPDPRSEASRTRYVVKPGVSLSPTVQARLARVADAYFRRTGKVLVVTSGTRDPHKQAAAMHQAMRVGADVMHLYRDKSAARELLTTFHAARAAKKSIAAIDAELAQVIERQIRRGVFISAHLRAGAADVRSRGMSADDRRAFLEGVARVGGFGVIEESAPPHFHLQLE